MSSKKSRLLLLIFSILCLVVLKYIVDYSAGTSTQILVLIAYGGLPLAGGLIGYNFCSLLGNFSGEQDSVTSHLLKAVSQDPARNFFISSLVTAYLSLIRPPLASNMVFLPYGEWVMTALAVYMIYATTRSSAEYPSVSSEGQSWKKHIQEISRETGRDLVRVTSAIECFINEGVKGALLVYLTLYVQRLGETEETILKTLAPLLEYEKNSQGSKLFSLVFPWKKEKIAKKNQKTREVLLKTLLDRIDGL